MLLYVHRNRKAHYKGKPRTATLTFTQLLSSGFEAVAKFAFIYDGSVWSFLWTIFERLLFLLTPLIQDSVLSFCSVAVRARQVVVYKSCEYCAGQM